MSGLSATPQPRVVTVELRKGYRFRLVSLAARDHAEATFDLYASDGEKRRWVCANVTKDEARQIRALIDGWLS